MLNMQKKDKLRTTTSYLSMSPYFFLVESLFCIVLFISFFSDLILGTIFFDVSEYLG